MKRVLTSQVLYEEMQYAAKRCKEFSSFLYNLKRDYEMNDANDEFFQLLEYRYEQMVFTREAQRNRIGNL